MCANLAGYFGNHFNGWLRHRHASESTCLLFLAACYFMGGVFITFVNAREKNATKIETPSTVESVSV